MVAKNIELEDKHKGQRCFLLGSGPSIKQENLKVLKNEIVFALNNFYVHPDFQEIMSGDVEKYYMTAPIHLPQTEQEWKDWFEDMEQYIPKHTKILFGLNTYKNNTRYILNKYELFNNHQVNWYYTGINTGEYYSFNKKDIKMTNMIWNANTISIYALISAIYMGFDEIYLLGIDHNYVCNQGNQWRFYKEGLHQKNEISRTMKGKSYNQHTFAATGKIFKQYQMLLEKNKIYNCSNTSLLDIFEYANLEKILKKSVN
ncbi:hypothetical protein CVFO_1263 [Isorropodon fossajaponicum endosymbiont JTNG4]|nr:hypothetical protein CVFO_1263 [Isorropodon fossajaponicum endosymbiont JTNG4]